MERVNFSIWKLSSYRAGVSLTAVKSDFSSYEWWPHIIRLYLNNLFGIYERDCLVTRVNYDTISIKPVWLAPKTWCLWNTFHSRESSQSLLHRTPAPNVSLSCGSMTDKTLFYILKYRGLDLTLFETKTIQCLMRHCPYFVVSMGRVTVRDVRLGPFDHHRQTLLTSSIYSVTVYIVMFNTCLNTNPNLLSNEMFRNIAISPE